MTTSQALANDPRRPKLRELQEIEAAVMKVAVADPTWVAPHDEAALRWALSLARVSAVNVLPFEGDPDLVEIGHANDGYRHRLHELLAPCIEGERVNRDALRAQIPMARRLCAEERRAILSLFGNRLPERALDRATRRRPLALAMGGGGGTGYVFMGAMAMLDEAGIQPSLIAGTSMGALLGAFRARTKEFSLGNVRQLLQRLSWRKVFRLFETESRFGLPATLKLYLREVIGHEFERDGRFLTLEDLEIPMRVTVGGLTQGVPAAEMQRYAHLLDDSVQDVRRLRSRAGGIARALTEITRQPVRALYLGGEEATASFDVLDAIGFSSAVPGIIHYDILRDDKRMIEVVTELLKRENVFRLVDGGLADNLPAREAWRAVQSGACVDRDPFVLALDSFAPSFGRHLLFLPLMRIAAENTRQGRAVAHMTISYKNVLSPLTVVPSPSEFLRAVENGREETAPHIPFIRKMIGPIPDPPGILTELA